MPTSDNKELKKIDSQSASFEAGRKIRGDFSEFTNIEKTENFNSNPENIIERSDINNSREFDKSATDSTHPAIVSGLAEDRGYSNIERILEEDLAGIYAGLTPKDQKRFKEKGEKTAQAIFDMIYKKAKIQIRRVVDLIREWLKTIPGINKYFLEQEAKIKADKIAEIAAREGKKVEF